MQLGVHLYRRCFFLTLPWLRDCTNACTSAGLLALCITVCCASVQEVPGEHYPSVQGSGYQCCKLSAFQVNLWKLSADGCGFLLATGARLPCTPPQQKVPINRGGYGNAASPLWQSPPRPSSSCAGMGPSMPPQHVGSLCHVSSCIYQY